LRCDELAPESVERRGDFVQIDLVNVGRGSSELRVNVRYVGLPSGRIGRTREGDEVVAVMVSSERYSLSVDRRDRVTDGSKVSTGDFEESGERGFHPFGVPFVERFRVPID